MSYILDALRKSDLQRQRGVAPTLHSVEPIDVPKKSLALAYSGLAIVLVGAGIAIGWLHPWEAEPSQPSPSAANVAIKPIDSIPQQSAVTAITPVAEVSPASAVPETTVTTVEPKQKPRAETSPSTPPIMVASKTPPLTAPDKPVIPEPNDSAPEQGVISMELLPASIRQELPQMTISLHAYSSKPADRLVSINNQLLHEGGSPAPGVTLEKITPNGMIFSYKEYRFQRGVQ